MLFKIIFYTTAFSLIYGLNLFAISNSLNLCFVFYSRNCVDIRKVMPHDLVVDIRTSKNTYMNSVPNQFRIGKQNNRKHRCIVSNATYTHIRRKEITN